MRRSVVALAGAVILIAGAGGAATAQTFFEKLFGTGAGSPQARTAPSRLGMQVRPEPRAASIVQSVPDDDRPQRRRSEQLRRDTNPDAEGKGQYQTYCVRACDGFYFPISRAVPRSRFHKDADACSARCGSDARLFYGPTDSDDKAALVDLSGRSYGDLPTAFKYRKSLVSGCSCRPMPWSEAELERHRSYAVAEVEQKAGIGGTGSVRRSAPAVASKLPPPVSGPGVTIMSADDDDNGEAATWGTSRGRVAGSVADAGGAGSVADVSGSEQQSVDDLAGAETRHAAPVTMRRLHRRGPAIAILNDSGARAPARTSRHERGERRERRQRHAAAHARPGSNGGGWLGGQSKYVYPGDAR